MHKLLGQILRIIIMALALMIGTFTFADEAPEKNVHVIVALADNDNQGIIPVPDNLGNGMMPRTNLYWGALYGVKSYFKRQDEIKTIKNNPPALPENVLEQMSFILKTYSGPVAIHAEAWRGDKMGAAIRSYYKKLAEPNGPDLMVFVGHNGLMDTFVTKPISIAGQAKPGSGKSAMVLACQSDSYFTATIQDLGATPVLMTKGNMAPEAYSLFPAIKAWAEGKPENEIRKSAAAGYAKYQKIPLRNANWLFGVKG